MTGGGSGSHCRQADKHVMGAAASLNNAEAVSNAALAAMADGSIPGLDTAALRPYLAKFLRMRKTGAPVGACYQAATHQMTQDGVDPSCLEPLNNYIRRWVDDAEAKGEQMQHEGGQGAGAGGGGGGGGGGYGLGEAKAGGIDSYLQERSGPAAEELLSAFGITELRG